MLQSSRTLLATLLLCLFNAVAYSQHWQWVKSSEGAVATAGFGITTDAAGNSYVTGYFTETVKLDNVTLTSSDQEDVLVVKYNAAGQVVWAKSAIGKGRDFGYGLVLDRQGNIFVTGRIKGSGPFLDESDIFISKYDPKGNLIWLQTAGGTGKDTGSSIVVDAFGNSYITGQFHNNAIFDDIAVIGSSGYNNFLAKYYSDGKVAWVKSAAGSYETFHNSVGIDAAGNIYQAGTFKHATTIGNINLTAKGFDDMYLAKYNPDGQAIWAKSAGGPRFDLVKSLAVDAAGNCYITGIFTSATVYFDGIAIANATNEGHHEIMIAKYNSAGQAIWAKSAGGPYNDWARAIAIDAEGNCYITGHISETAYFGAITLKSQKNHDIVVAKLNATGEFVWVKQAGGPWDDDGNAIAVDTQGNGYVTGTYNERATFDNFKLEKGNMYVAKFGPTPLPEPIPEPPVVEKLFIPNIITPNGDGLNDTFVPSIPGNIPVNLKVYSRTGQAVYEQADYQNAWNANNLSDGTYYYLLTTATGQVWKGWVEIIR